MNNILKLFVFAIHPSFLFAWIPLNVEGTVLNDTKTGMLSGVNIPGSEHTTFTYQNNSITSVNSKGYILRNTGLSVDTIWDTTEPETTNRSGAAQVGDLINATATGKIYYISSTGNDSGSGSINSPWFTLNKAWKVISAGDIVYLRGGTYQYTTSQELTGENGTAGNLINIWAYPGEHPIITRAVSWKYKNKAGIYFEGDYFHWIGIEIKGFYQIDGGLMVGLRVQDSNHNIFELIDCSHNGAGMTLSHESDDNLVLYCDFHHNYDPLTAGDPYGNGDGIEIGEIPTGHTNTVRGCRLWSNSDDGIDLWHNDGYVFIDNCQSWNNGYKEDGVTKGGDGIGYKLGTTNKYPTTNLRTITNSLAFYNRTGGFSLNGAVCIVRLYNNIGYHNAQDPTGYNINFGFGDAVAHVLKNNIAYANQYPSNLQAQIGANCITSNNTWNGGVVVTDADFVSLDATGVDGARQADGSLPDINFLHLAPGSDLIHAGVDVGIPYSGNAPDIGTFEIQPANSSATPVYTGSVIENATPAVLEMTYNLNLGNIVPSASAFAVRVNSGARAVNSVTVSGTKVILNLEYAVIYGDVVTVAYTKPSANPLQTTSGGQAASVSAQAVTNKVSLPSPVYVSSAIGNATPAILEMTYNLNLGNIAPAASAFAVRVNSAVRNVNSVIISGTKVILILEYAIVYGDVITVAYNKPSVNPLQTTYGVQAASITSQSVTNNCLVIIKNDPPVPVINYKVSNYSEYVGEIDASGSYDLNNDILNFQWIVPNKISVSSTGSPKIKFLFPVVNTIRTFEFQLNVNDGRDVVSRIIPIIIMPY